MTDINNLFKQWQNCVEGAQSTAKETGQEDDSEQLYVVAGMAVRSGLAAGQLFSLLTICRCE